MRLSVIIPTHNRCSLLREAISSVLRQNVTSCEIIVCDDGSTDDTSELFGSYSATESRVRWSRTEKCHGAQVARNRGLALAQCGAVLFLDSDDVLADKGILPLLQKLEEDPTLDFAYGKIIQTDAQLKPLAGSMSIGAPFSDAPVDVAGWHWAIMGAVYRKSYLEKVGTWNEALTGSQDWEYQARVKLAGGRGQFVDAVVGYWRHHGGSRVGTKAFRPDYVRSVMLASDVILTLARQAGRCDRALERRLAKKLILHALEWGANGHPDERRQCLLQAARTVLGDQLCRALIGILQISPSSLDSRLWKAFTKRRS